MSDTSDESRFDRQHFLGTAAVSAAAAQLSLVGCASDRITLT